MAGRFRGFIKMICFKCKKEMLQVNENGNIFYRCLTKDCNYHKAFAE
jgi:hypothetical protein